MNALFRARALSTSCTAHSCHLDTLHLSTASRMFYANRARMVSGTRCASSLPCGCGALLPRQRILRAHHICAAHIARIDVSMYVEHRAGRLDVLTVIWQTIDTVITVDVYRALAVARMFALRHRINARSGARARAHHYARYHRASLSHTASRIFNA